DRRASDGCAESTSRGAPPARTSPRPAHRGLRSASTAGAAGSRSARARRDSTNSHALRAGPGGAELRGRRLRSPTRPSAEDDVERDADRENADADQLAGGEIPPGSARRRADEIEDAAALLVAAHRLDGGAQRRIQPEVAREQLAV